MSVPVDEQPQHSDVVRVEEAERAVADFLTAFGYDPHSARFRQTPERVVQAFRELTQGDEVQVSSFPNEAGYTDPLVVRDITFVSVCEHHLLPFRGVAHIGYVPGERVVGLSALAHVVRERARGLQLQELLTVVIADTLEEALESSAIGVVVEAEHDCMSVRGVKAEGAVTVTTAFRGTGANDAHFRNLLLGPTPTHGDN